MKSVMLQSTKFEHQGVCYASVMTSSISCIISGVSMLVWKRLLKLAWRYICHDYVLRTFANKQSMVLIPQGVQTLSFTHVNIINYSYIVRHLIERQMCLNSIAMLIYSFFSLFKESCKIIIISNNYACGCWYDETWWRHHMETFSALLAFCTWNSPVTGEFP